MQASCHFHYNDVIMGMMASQITSLTIVYSTVIQAQIKENIKAPRHWPLCREFTGSGEFPAQRASNAENVSIWWRHHVMAITWWCHGMETLSSWMHLSVVYSSHRGPVMLSVHVHVLLAWTSFSTNNQAIGNNETPWRSHDTIAIICVTYLQL